MIQDGSVNVGKKHSETKCNRIRSLLRQRQFKSHVCRWKQSWTSGSETELSVGWVDSRVGLGW